MSSDPSDATVHSSATPVVWRRNRTRFVVAIALFWATGSGLAGSNAYWSD
jgi:hypothetical protein